MTREASGKADLRILWMGIDDEVLVRRHRVHARGSVRNLSIQRRNSRRDRGPNCHLITRTDAPVDCGWGAFLTPRMNAHFWITSFLGSGKSVEQGALLRLPNENRKDSPIESRRLASRFKQNMTRRETMTGIETLGTNSANQGPTEITSDLAS